MGARYRLCLDASDHFTRECISRALLTLPYSTLDPDDHYDGGGEPIRRMRAIVEGVNVSASEIRYISDTLGAEVAVHRSADNWIKADVIERFRESLVNAYVEVYL